MSEKPIPSTSLLGEAVDWAQKKVIEANSGRYAETVYQTYNELVDVFLARRLEVARRIEEAGGLERLSGYGSRKNGIICKNGLFIPASEVLSVKVLDEEIQPPTGAPHGTRMNHAVTAWFGGDGVISDPWDLNEVDHGVMWNGGGMELVFTPGYLPQSVGITETIKTSVDGLNEAPEEFSEHFLLESDDHKIKNQRSVANPSVAAKGLMDRAAQPRNKGLLLTFKATGLFQDRGRAFRDWVSPYFVERYAMGTEVVTNIDSVNNLLRFSRLVKFIHDEVVGQTIVRQQTIDNPTLQITG